MALKYCSQFLLQLLKTSFWQEPDVSGLKMRISILIDFKKTPSWCKKWFFKNYFTKFTRHVMALKYCSFFLLQLLKTLFWQEVTPTARKIESLFKMTFTLWLLFTKRAVTFFLSGNHKLHPRKKLKLAIWATRKCGRLSRQPLENTSYGPNKPEV